MILVKADNNPVTPPTIGSSPSNFPTSGTAGCRTTHVNQYRTPPRVVDQGFGAGVNPAGAGGGGGAAEFDEQDTCPAPKKHESNQNNLEHPASYQSKKNKESELENNLTDQKKQTLKGVEIDFDS